MAPPSKKAKKADGPKPVAGGGLSKFFSSQNSVPAKPAEEAKGVPEEKQQTETTPVVTNEAVLPVAPPVLERPNEPTVEAAAQPLAEKPSGVEAAPKPSGLTDEQRARIDENRKAAIAKKRAREAKAAAENSSPVSSDNSPPPALSQSPEPQVTGTTKSPEKTPTAARGPVCSETTPEKPQISEKQMRDANAGKVDEGSSCKFERLPPMTKWVQYNSLYNARLSQLKGAALDEARRLWGGMVDPDGFMSDLSGYKKGKAGSEVVVAGVLFKDMKKRPNVIEEILRAKGIASIESAEAAAEAKIEQFSTENDVLWLEENGMRVQLVVSKDQMARHATGFVIAARGSATNDGHFRMSGFCLPRTEPTAPLRSVEAAQNGPFVAFLSGLALGSTAASLLEARNRALTFLLGKGEDSVALSRIIVCGGSFAEEKQLGTDGMKAALKDADAFFAQLAEAAPLNVLPGQGDPTNAALPQRALHPYLFKNSWACKNFKAVSNPYSYEAEGVSFLGHSGLPVKDLMRCATFSSPLEALMYCLEARHIAPTAPDTLPTQPFGDSDPFVLDKAPHVFFSGGHQKLEYQWRPCPRGGESGTQCICVPSFETTCSLVLVHAKDPRVVRAKEFVC